MHLLGKASPIYIFHHDGLYMIVWASLVCYGQFGLALDDLDLYPWLMAMLLEKCHIYALSCVNAFIWAWHVLVAWLCLICGWIASLLIIWGQRLICHQECLALLLYLVEGHKFLFVAKTFHVPNMNLKMKYKSAWKMCSHVICTEFNLLWVLNRCMMPTNEKSHI
jgi:hypothetical protein